MLRFPALAVLLLSLCCRPLPPPPPIPIPNPQPAATVQGVVADPTGAIVPNAEVNLVECRRRRSPAQLRPTALATSRWPRRTPAASRSSFPSRASKPFTCLSPCKPNVTSARLPRHTSSPRRCTSRCPSPLSPQMSASTAIPTKISLPPKKITTPPFSLPPNLKELPIFDNDYVGAMSVFLDDSASGTGGSGLMVDGVEANRSPRLRLRSAGSSHQPGSLLRAVLLAGPRADGNHHQIRRGQVSRPIQFSVP